VLPTRVRQVAAYSDSRIPRLTQFSVLALLCFLSLFCFRARLRRRAWKVATSNALSRRLPPSRRATQKICRRWSRYQPADGQPAARRQGSFHCILHQAETGRPLRHRFRSKMVAQASRKSADTTNLVSADKLPSPTTARAVSYLPIAPPCAGRRPPMMIRAPHRPFLREGACHKGVDISGAHRTEVRPLPMALSCMPKWCPELLTS